MTEQLPAGRTIHANVWAMNTPAELFSTHTEGALIVTLDPPAIYVRNEGQWVPLASVAGNIPAPTLVGASEDAAGVAELATQEETNAGSDTFRIVTPARLSGRAATEARSGVVELATARETADGTDGTRAVHPAGMKAAMAPEGWIAPTLTNGWVNSGAPFETAAFYKEAPGRLFLRGTIKNGTLGAATFTLPIGYRPPADLPYIVPRGAETAGRAEVRSNGVVVVTHGNNVENSLNGISFRV